MTNIYVSQAAVTRACDHRVSNIFPAVVRHRRLLRRLTRREIVSRYRTLSTEGAPGPPEASDVRADDGGGPWPPLPPGGRGGHGRK